MNRDDIIRMAGEAGFRNCSDGWFDAGFHEEKFERFAALVIAAEREACAKACEEHQDGLNMMGGAFVTCADAIRARTEK